MEVCFEFSHVLGVYSAKDLAITRAKDYWETKDARYVDYCRVYEKELDNPEYHQDIYELYHNPTGNKTVETYLDKTLKKE